jgi:hypothetical protein
LNKSRASPELFALLSYSRCALSMQRPAAKKDGQYR